MKYTVYVLIDDKGVFYKGLTSNLRRRLYEHKSLHTRTTARMKNVRLAYTEEFDSLESARKRELYLKSAAGRRFLKQKIGPVA